MKRFLVLFIVSVLGLSACQEKKVKAVDPRLATDTLKIHFQPTRKAEVTLTPVAQQAIKGWENFPELEAQMINPLFHLPAKLTASSNHRHWLHLRR